MKHPTNKMICSAICMALTPLNAIAIDHSHETTIGSGPLSMVHCERETSPGNILHYTLITDTRHLNANAASIVSENKLATMSNKGKCQNNISNDLNTERLLDHALRGESIMKTYLHYKDDKNMVNIFMYNNAGEQNEAMCESLKKIIIAQSPSAKCIFKNGL